MFAALLSKDLRRARRNPLPYLIHLALPLVITALLGLVFRGANRSDAGLGRIRFAVVDEDDSLLTGFLRGALSQGQGVKRLEPVFLDRDKALAEVTNNRLSAALIIPDGFTRGYIAGTNPVRLELVKNPAQAFHPAVLEELLGAVVTGLNALARNFRPDLEAWNALIRHPGGPDADSIAEQVRRTGRRIEALGTQLDPPRVWYVKETRAAAPAGPAGMPAFSLFAFVLPGLTAMFLMFMAEVAIRDLYRELRFRTFVRYCTYPSRVGVFVGAKVAFALAILGLGAAILLGGGSAVFGFRWKQPLAVAEVAAAYALFAAGAMALLAALARTEQRADAFGNIIAMALGLAGGCAFPAEALPAFLRDHITPWLPTHWFVEGLRALELGAGPAWGWIAVKLALLGALLTAGAAWLFDRHLRKGAGA